MIVFLTGAGISKESGIATFRDTGGLWEQERVEDVATPAGFARDPERVFTFYNARRKELQQQSIQPNPAHLALAELEKQRPGDVLLVTQNVDNLHERAGSKAILHMHGELLKARCTACGKVFEWVEDLDFSNSCLFCSARGKLRPHIVWFEEMPLYMDEIQAAIARCSYFVSIGTSGNVYPAAGFSAYARHHGARVIELNLEKTHGEGVFHEGFYGPASEVVPAWVETMLQSRGG